MDVYCFCSHRGVPGDPRTQDPQPLLLLQDLALDECKLEDFEVGPVLGTGSFGRVSLARHKGTRVVCAVKALSKAHIVKNQQVRKGVASNSRLKGAK